jgi:hypothetical protein
MAQANTSLLGNIPPNCVAAATRSASPKICPDRQKFERHINRVAVGTRNRTEFVAAATW